MQEKYSDKNFEITLKMMCISDEAINIDGTSGAPFFGSCLVAFGKENDDILYNCGIEGKYVLLNGCV